MKFDQLILKVALIETLKQLRLDSQLTQKELAKKIGKPQSYVSKYENGERKLDFSEVYTLCKLLDIKISYLEDIFEQFLQDLK